MNDSMLLQSRANREQVTTIVLDTSALLRDRWLRFVNDPMINESVRTGTIRFAVPDIVVREFGAHCMGVADAACSALRKALPRASHELAINQFRAHGSAANAMELFTSLGFQVLPVPAVSHDELLRRLFDKRKPFRVGDGPSGCSDLGYRDSLIWHTVLELLQRDPGEVWFITNNERDFYSSNGKRDRLLLHEDLVEDLRGLKLLSERLRLARSIPEFKEAVLTPRFQARSELIVALESDGELMQILRNAYASALEQLDDYTWESIADVYHSGIPASHFGISPDLDMTSMALDQLEICNLNEIGGGQLSISTAVPMVADMSIVLNWRAVAEFPTEAHRYFNAEEFVRLDGEPGDWTPGAVRKSRVDLVVQMTARLELSSKSLTDPQFTWWGRNERGAPKLGASGRRRSRDRPNTV